MSGERKLRSSAPSTAIAALTAMVVTFTCWAGLSIWLEPLFYERYAGVLGWGTVRGYLGFLISAAMLAGLSCGNRGWRGVPLALLAGSAFAATAVANVIAATATLWALDPSLVTGLEGRIIVELTGLLLNLPVAYGALVLTRRWLESDMSWRDRLRNDGPRGPMGLRLLLVVMVMLLAWLAAAATIFGLASAFPAIHDTRFFMQSFLVVATANFVATANLPDLRSVLRVLLATLVLFEASITLAVSSTAVLATLRSDNILLAVTVELLLLAPVYLGAVLLTAHRPGIRGNGVEDRTEMEAKK